MIRCRICVLPYDFPNASFDANGICRYCRERPVKSAVALQMRGLRDAFLALARDRRGKSPYEMLLCFSGGKDSAYSLWLVKKKFGLKTLAFTFDNGFIADETRDNIRRVTESLSVDHLYLRADTATLNRVLRASLESNPYSPKSVERASVVCASCMGIVKYSAFRTAVEKEIPFVGFGWTPGQAPVTSSVMKLTAPMLEGMQASVKGPMEGIAGRALDEYFLEPRHLADAEKIPCIVHPAAFFPYSEKRIYAVIRKLGWRAPTGLDANSTNCLLNSLAVVNHQKNYGIHPYAHEIAKLVREGHLSRAKGIRRLEKAPDKKTVAAVKKRLGV